VGVLDESSPGLWSVGVFPGHADELLGALDPTVPFVLIECGNPRRGWHDALVTIGPESSPVSRRVRNVSFDVLTTPAEASGLGPLLRADHDGRLRAIQLTRQPSAHFRLPMVDRGLARAMRGLGVHLIIDLPHDGEIANIRATQASVLRAFTGRI
jgi:hypothetical protein